MKKIIYSVMAIAALTFSFTSLTSCEDVPAPYEIPGGDDDVPTEELKTIFSEDFSNGQGGFTFSNVKLSDGLSYVWKATSYQTSYYLIASAYSNGASHESESWAVSPAINLSDCTTATLSFSHAINKLDDTSKMQDFMTVWASTDYAGDAATATWTKLEIPSYPAGTSWSSVESGDIDLKAFCGKEKVYIGYKYMSENNMSGSWEVNNFKIMGDGTPMADDIVTPDNPTSDNDGTEAKPYTAKEAIAKGAATNVFVKAYIVGCVNDKALTSASFDATNFTSQTNILVASTADETDVNNCLPVQLPSGAVRTGLNLKDNAGNYKKEVLLYGNIEKYFLAVGIKSVTYAKIDGTEYGTKPSGSSDDSTPSGSDILNETFASGIGSFTTVDVKLGEGMSYVWKHDSSYKYMKASAFVNNTNLEAESWLVSGKLNMSKVSDATLSFDQAINYLNGNNRSDYVKVLASVDYNGDVAKANWTELSVSSWPAGTGWDFGSSTASMKAFAGKSNVTIAFKYTSSTSCAPTWEVKNVVVK